MKLLLPVILVIIAIVVFFTYINPTYAEIKELQVEVDRFDEALGRANELAAVRDALLSRFNALNPDDQARLEKLLPDHVDNVRTVLDLDSIAARHNMSLEGINLGDARQSNENDGGRALQFEDVSRESIEIGFSVESSYKGFLRFLTDLEKSLRLLDVTSIVFSASDTDLAKYSIRARIYWLK